MNLDIVVPFFNEEACLQQFCRNLIKTLDQISDIYCHFYFVDDGSIDNTPELLKKLVKEDARITIITLWGNHGHQKALVAGLDECKGDAVLMLDGDGQHPVNVAAELVRLSLKNTNMAIIQAIRQEGQGNKIKEWTSRFFYWLMNRLLPDARIEQGASDFRVIRQEALEIIKSYPDRYRNLRVLFSTLRLPTLQLSYRPLQRIGGTSKYNWRKMLNLAADGIFTFSSLPLRLSILLMVGTGLLGFLYAIYSIIVYLQNSVVPGWTSVVALIGLISSAIFAVLAIMAQYIRRIYEDVRRPPIYIRNPHLNKRMGADSPRTHRNDI